MTATTPQVFNRWGTRVTITGYCGKHQPKWAAASLILLRVTYHHSDEGGSDEQGYVYATSLKADGGWPTIDAAVDAAPKVELTAKELKAAMKAAE